MAREIEPLVVEIDSCACALEAFRSVAQLPHPFFLDSAADLARCDGAADYSIVGCDPFLTLPHPGPPPQSGEGESRRRAVSSDPFDALGGLLEKYRSLPAPGLPFCGGAVGYLGYDLCHFVERLPRTTLRDVDLPDMFFGFYDAAVVFDHRAGRVFIVSNGLPETGKSGRARARERAEWLRGLVEEPGELGVPATRLPFGRAKRTSGPSDSLSAAAKLSCNFTRDDYLRAVERAREYIFAGDIYQVNLSQRFAAEFDLDPVSLYENLRATSPAPFGAYLDTGTARILSNSPERFLRKSGDGIETRPIKGTRPRGADAASDRRLAEELIACDKDAAEHLMIVDLERNDLGRVCEHGTVTVDELVRLESYWNVHHLVSTVSGTLRPDVTLARLLRATFPGGSITGAPKIRAMEIIDELEPTARGIYTGAIGYLSLCGTIDLNIAIRTMICDGATGYFQVGGGIVADSDPAAEYDETLDKAAAFFALLESSSREAAKS